MLKVRLQRTGKRGQAYFRVVVLEHTKKPKGKFLELLGNYDPHKKEFKVNMERISYWLSNGAQVSPTVNNLLVNYKYWDKPKVQSWKPKRPGAEVASSVEPQEPVPTESVQHEDQHRDGDADELKPEPKIKEETKMEEKSEPTPEVGSPTENIGAEEPKQEEAPKE